MRVKTRLYVIAIMSLLSIGVIVVGMVWMNLRVEGEIRQARYATDLALSISDLHSGFRYLSIESSRGARREWSETYQKFNRLLLAAPAMDGERKYFKQSIDAAARGLESLLAHADQRQEQPGQPGFDITGYWSQRVFLQLERLQENSLRLAWLAETALADKTRQNHYVKGGVLLPLIILTVFISLRLARQLGTNIERLGQAMALVAEGEGVSRGEKTVEVPVHNDDEISQLARHFNHMVGELRAASEAQTRLQHEVRARAMALEKRERHFRGLFDNMISAIMVLRFDSETQDLFVLEINRAARFFSSRLRSAVAGQNFADLFNLGAGSGLHEMLCEVGRHGKDASFPPMHYQDPVNDFWMEGFAYRLPQGEVVLVFNDVSAKIKAEAKLRLWEKIFDSTSEGVIITDAHSNILEVNAAFTTITQYSREEVVGRNPVFLKSDRHNDRFYRQMWQEVRERGLWRGEVWHCKKDGTLYPEFLNISRVQNNAGDITHYVTVFSDISALKQSQEKLDYLAHHDPLTGLPNRLLFNALLEQSIKHAKRVDKMLAVVFVDLDRFKNINDSFGHPAGDSLLQQVADRFNEGLRREDTVARISGDEFVILLNDLASRDAAASSLEKLLRLFEHAFQIDRQEIRVTASLGVSLYPLDGESPTDLMRNADTAMYCAKDDGRNSWRFYTRDLSSNMLEKVLLENSLRGALERQEFSLVYQPQVNLETGDLIGMEVLLRWCHPPVGTISPALFIPMAEANGLIHDIGAWVLRSACEQGKIWLDSGVHFDRLSVNVAGSQILKPGFAERVAQALEVSGFPARYLELEITESYIMQDTQQAILQLSAIRGLDVLLSIDDFGTGYSSLSYLKKLPVHKLKIDQSFVRDLPDDEEDVAIAEAVIALGKALDKKVIAEGVETLEQARFLIGRGCVEAQGYLFGPPVPAEQMTVLLQREKLFDVGALTASPDFPDQ